MVAVPGHSWLHEISRSPTTLVYRARRDADNAPVVIKTHAGDAPAVEQLARLQHEFELLRSVDSPNVAKAYDLVPTPHGLALILEDRGGRPLARRGAAVKQAPVADVLRIARDAVAGLGALHRAGIVHRGVTPWHLVHNPITRETQVIDLSHASRLCRGVAIEASPFGPDPPIAYISPEQTGRTSRLVDHRTDFYSLGVTLYALLAGALPFTSDDPLEVIHAQLAKSPPAPSSINPSIPPFLSDIVMRLLEKSPEDRYQSAEGIAGDIEALLAHLGQGPNRAMPLPASVGGSDAPLWFEIPNKLYGRERALAAIGRSVARCANGEARIVCIQGPSGVGKSSLVAAIRGLLGKRGGYFGYGKFEQLSGKTPYSAVIQALRALVRKLLTEPEAALAIWKQRFELALGSNLPFVVGAIPELESLLGPQPPAPEVGPLEARARLNFAFRAYLQSIALPEHPLALFLDDLQWADSASFGLIESLFLDSEMHHIVFLGAYRDDEIDAASPAALTLERLQADARCEAVRLTPLSADTVAAMLSDAFGLSASEVAEIAELCVERTSGNPMLIRELITSLVDAEIIRPSGHEDAGRARTWRWELAAVRRSPLTDNVAKLISRRICGLPAPARRFVQQAACIGNAVQLSHAARAAELPLTDAARLVREAIACDIVSISPEDERTLSWLASGMPVASGPIGRADVEFVFRHDLVLQAAYASIPEEELPRLHLRAGRALRAAQRDGDPDVDVFSIARQLNRARALVTAEERVDLAQLNLTAGKRAAESSAHEAALGHFDVALELLDGSAWEDHRELLAELHLRGAEAACVTGALDRSDALIHAALQRARSAVERARLLKVRVMRRTLAGDYAAALAAGSEALRGLGASPVPPAAEVGGAMRKRLAWVDDELRARSISALRALPNADRESEQTRLLGEILATLNAPMYFAGPEYLAWLAVATVEHSLRHGHTAASAGGYVVLGSIFSNMLGRHREGYELGELALWIADKFNDGRVRSQVRLIFANNYLCRTRPIRSTFALNDEGFRASIESGDLAWAGYFQMFRLYHPLSAGEPLATLEARLPEHLRFCRKTKHQLMCDVIEGLHAVLENLRGRTQGELCFDLPGRPEALFVEEWMSRGSVMALAKYSAAKAMALYLHGDAAGALRCATEAERRKATMFGQFSNEEALHYGTLSLVRLAASASGEDRKEKLDQVRQRNEQMGAWAARCPENFAHCHLLVEAERQRLAGDSWAAARSYNEAIRLAATNGFQQSAALANELAGRFWMAVGWSPYGESHLREAHRGYEAWGARRKAALLEQEFRFLCSAGGAPAAPEAAALEEGSPGFQVDLASIFKATGAVSSSLVETELHERLLRIAVENAGARRGVLLVQRDEHWSIEAEIDVRLDRMRVGVGAPLATSGARIPHSVINYVRRLKTAVVIDDALQSESFRADPYYAGSRPVSVLCVPILRQSVVTAILYLDNDLVAGAFRPGQVEILRILASQAAISLDNAQLYEKLHQLNIDLQKRCEEAQVAARLKTEFVANASHELRTPLNGLVNIPEALLRDFQQVTRFTCAACAQEYEDDGEEAAAEPVCPTCGRALAAREHLRFVGDAAEHALFLRQMIGAAEHLRRLVNDLLDFSRIEAGQMPLALERLRVVDVFAEVSTQIARVARLKAMTVTFDADERISLTADRIKLCQVLINLIENAIKFSPEDQRIEVSAVEKQSGGAAMVHFSVKDNGIGIPPDKLEEIFESFKQVDGSHTRAYGGVGLGLALCRRIVDLHWGRIWVESRLGGGSTFWFALPVAQGEPGRPREGAAPVSREGAVIGREMDRADA